jgi:hypothetical protein
MKQSLTLKERSIALFLNIFLAYLIFVWSTDQWLLSGGIEALWLMSAISLWFLNLLSAPWFLPPRDTIISAVAALLVLTTVDFHDVGQFRTELEIMRWLFVIFSITIAIVAIVALFLHDKDSRSAESRFAFRIANIFGKGEILFSAPALISIVGAYQSSFTVMAWLLLYWIMITIMKPVETIAIGIKQYNKDKNNRGCPR